MVMVYTKRNRVHINKTQKNKETSDVLGGEKKRKLTKKISLNIPEKSRKNTDFRENGTEKNREKNRLRKENSLRKF